MARCAHARRRVRCLPASFAVSGEWDSEQVADELRTARLARSEDPPPGEPVAPETDPIAGYREEVQGGLQAFRGRVAVAGLAWTAVVTASFFLFGEKLKGAAGQVYGWALVVSGAALIVWMTWLMVRYLIRITRGHRKLRTATDGATSHRL